MRGLQPADCSRQTLQEQPRKSVVCGLRSPKKPSSPLHDVVAEAIAELGDLAVAVALAEVFDLDGEVRHGGEEGS